MWCSVRLIGESVVLLAFEVNVEVEGGRCCGCCFGEHLLRRLYDLACFLAEVTTAVATVLRKNLSRLHDSPTAAGGHDLSW